jgi:hypothetical protein
MTINMEGELNIWDYDSSKHDIHKAQSSRILDDTIRSPTFNLIKNKTSPKMFMVLTNKNIMAVNNGEFIPQFIIPSDPKTQWQNGDFFNKDHLTLWTMHGDIFYYKIQESIADNSKYRYAVYTS